MTKKAARFFPTNRGSGIKTGRELRSLGKGWSSHSEKVDAKYEIDVSKTYSSLRHALMSLPIEIKIAQNKTLVKKLARLSEMQRLIIPFEPLLREANFENVPEKQKRILTELFSALPEQWEISRYKKLD